MISGCRWSSGYPSLTDDGVKGLSSSITKVELVPQIVPGSLFDSRHLRKNKMLETGDASKLRDSIKTYGSNSYYYAHSRKIEIPADAIRVEGDGLVTGGTPVLLKVGAAPTSIGPVTKRLTAYAWADSGETVKIYIEDADWLAAAQGQPESIQSDFADKSCTIKVTDAKGLVTVFSIDNLDDEIEPSGCSYRLSPLKRFTITLKKAKVNKTWYALRKN